jgi:hypothetical protein
MASLVRPGVTLLLLVAGAPLLARFYARNEHLGALPETISAGAAAHAIVHARSFDIAPYYPAAEYPAGLPYSVRPAGDRLYSMQFPASPLTFAPLMLPYRDYPPQGFRLRRHLFLDVAARLTTVTVLLLAAWMLTLTSVPRALLVTAVVAFATSLRTIAATGLWEHTSAAPWLVTGLALWCWAPRRPWLYPLAGAALAAATACRPNLFPAALLVCWSAARDGRRGGARPTAGAVVAVGGLALVANWSLYGSILGGRSAIVSSITHTHAVGSYVGFSLWNLVGLLAAPSRGLFVYSPVLLFALPGLVRSLRASAPPAERLITVAGLLVFLLYGFVATWWAGWGFGPRYLTDLLPFAALWLVRTPLPRAGAPVAAAAFVAALAWSGWTQELGVRAYPCGWEGYPANVDQAPERLWTWHDTEIARCWAALERRRGP